MEENTTDMLPDTDEQAMDERDGALIEYDWERDVRSGDAERRSPDEVEAAWNAPVQEEAAHQSGESTASDGKSYRLKHLGREFDVSRDELITLAQKGVDYDRIRDRADRLSENLKQRDASAMERMSEAERRRERETQEFIEVYSGVKPKEIPQEVWSEVAGGKSLLLAYQSYENRLLRTQLEAERREAQNRLKTTGPRPTLGAPINRGELEADWYRD